MGVYLSVTRGSQLVTCSLFYKFLYRIYLLYAYSKVAKAIVRLIALALNLEIDYFDREEIAGKPIAVLRLLYYEGKDQIAGHGTLI